MLAVEDSDTCQVKTIYQYNICQKRVDELRSCQLQKDTGLLKIWDHLEKQELFEGIAVLNEEGQPANSEYYDLLFWKDLYLPGDLGEIDAPSAITVWANEPITEKKAAIQRELFGSDGSPGECGSRETLLAALEMNSSAPMYQYFDCYHNVHLELYGIIINAIPKGGWTGHDPFSTKAVDGSDGADSVDAYEEITRDTPDGRPDYFCSQGLMERE